MRLLSIAWALQAVSHLDGYLPAVPTTPSRAPLDAEITVLASGNYGCTASTQEE